MVNYILWGDGMKRYDLAQLIAVIVVFICEILVALGVSFVLALIYKILFFLGG